MFAASKTAGAVSAEVNYIEECFSAFLYTGNGSTQTITNGIDLSTKGGLVWFKARNIVSNHGLYDTDRGATNSLISNSTNGQSSVPNGLTAFNTNGFSTGNNATLNGSGNTFASWTFRKQPKFFDVVTWTGNTTSTSGTVYRQLSHSLASTVGTIIVKRTSSTGSWPVYHRSLPTSGDAGGYLFLNTTDVLNYTSGYFPTAGYVGSNGVTSTYNSSVFTVGEDINQTGSTYVAYLFAHNAGGFGLTGTDNVISCGSYTGNGSSTGPTITLGYEPQWVLIKNTSDAYDWQLYDVMRGMSDSATGSTMGLSPNTTAAEVSRDRFVYPTATGFAIGNGTSIINQGGGTMIYIAIRRGPMKVPTSGTSVFVPSANLTNTQYTVGFPNDWAIEKRPAGTTNWRAGTRLTGNNAYLDPNSTAAEVANTTWIFNGPTNTFTQLRDATGALVYSFKRAPSYFDVVCYTGNGTYGGRNHNLTVTPELIITKKRSATSAWTTIFSALGSGYMYLNTTAASGGSWGTLGTSTVFYPSDDDSGSTYVAYLFATCAGVSKVGSYTGNGSTQTINCGFTGGARFVLIKRTDSTSDWYVYDTARGMTTLTDPYLLLNSTAAESATLGSVTTVSTGFAVNASILAAINTNAASYIFLAIS